MSGLEEAKRAITEVCEALKTSPAIGRAIDDLCAFLIAKNKKYNNSVFEPLRMFSRGSVEDLIRVRLDDKVTRILRGQLAGEDSFDDFAGYMILLRALPIYLRSLARRFSDDDMGIVALTYNRLCDVAGVEVAERVFLATPVGGDVVEDMQKAIEAAAKSPVPGHVVTQSLRDRGLRVGMTYREVRDNKWTECDGKRDLHDDAPSCTESDPCSACKFLDGAMCKCGHSFARHGADCKDCRHTTPDGCWAFSLASWTPDSDGLTYREEPGMVYKSVDANAKDGLDGVAAQVADAINASDSAWVACVSQTDGSTVNLIQSQVQPKKETDMTDTNTTTTKKPRIDRKTWRESPDGKHAIGSVLGFLSESPIVSWAIGKLTERSGLARADVDLAIDHLLSTGAIDQHGKAKGTRYAVAGFTDWPAPTPRNRKSNEPPVSEADADAAHSLDASDSEET